MRDLSQLWMRQLLPVAILIVLALMLTACAAPSRLECEGQKPLPVELREPSLPDARGFSEKVQSYFLRVESWLSERPLEQTP